MTASTSGGITLSVYVPEAVPALANVKLWAVLTIINSSAPKLATEISAATSLDVSQYLYADGWTPTLEQGKGQARRRLGSKRNQERLNTPVEQIGNLQYVFDPQLPDTDPINKAYALFVPGTELYLVQRLGKDVDAAGAVGQFVDVHRVSLGERAPVAPVEDENADIYITQGVINLVPVVRKVALVA